VICIHMYNDYYHLHHDHHDHYHHNHHHHHHHHTHSLLDNMIQDIISNFSFVLVDILILATSIPSSDPFYLWCIQGIYGVIVAVFIIVCGLSILRNVKVTATTYHLLTISFLVYIAYNSV